MLTLPIKKKWFSMIFSGEKKEEYREIKDYYISRFSNCLGVSKELFEEWIRSDYIPKNNFNVYFRNGYSKRSPAFIADVSLSIGSGKEEWGAEKGKKYFILSVNKLITLNRLEEYYVS